MFGSFNYLLLNWIGNTAGYWCAEYFWPFHSFGKVFFV